MIGGVLIFAGLGLVLYLGLCSALLVADRRRLGRMARLAQGLFHAAPGSATWESARDRLWRAACMYAAGERLLDASQFALHAEEKVRLEAELKASALAYYEALGQSPNARRDYR